MLGLLAGSGKEVVSAVPHIMHVADNVGHHEREIYARRPCIVLQRGIVGRVPWCKVYTDPLPFCGAPC